MASRILPHNLEAEAALLGTILLRSENIGIALEKGITAAHFYKPANGHVFEAMVALYSSGEPIDPVTVSEQLRRVDLLDRVGGISALLSLEADTPSFNADRYAKIVDDHHLLREVIRTAMEVQEQGLELPLDVRAYLDEAESRFYELGQSRAVDSTILAQTAAVEEIERLQSKGKGIKTGLVDLDRILGGLFDSNLIVIGARPAAGKTSAALHIASSLAEKNVNTLFFSLEMSHEELAQRTLAIRSDIPISNFRTSLYEKDWFKLKDGLASLEGLPLYFDDNPLVTVNEMRAKARRVKNLGLIVVDYIQLMTAAKRPENRQNEVAEISRSLKILARELHVPVVALSQLSRNLESRPNKRPNLSDLRESGQIEQDSDVVLFLYRDEIYDPDTKDKGVTEFIVAKHRNGPLGMARMAFIPRYAKFCNIDE